MSLKGADIGQFVSRGVRRYKDEMRLCIMKKQQIEIEKR